MFFNLLYFSPIIILISVITILTHYKHLLMVLLNLEIMILGLLITLYENILFPSYLEPLIILSLLTIAACAASLGLGLLVKMTRTYGNDNLMSLSMLKC